jgi:hypothetical protein
VLVHPQIGMGEGPGYLPSFPTKREDLQGYDVVFLGDVGVTKGMISPEQATMLRGLIEQQASGLVFLPGPLGWQRTLKDSPLGDLVPVETDYEKGAGMVNFSAGSGFSTAGETKLELTFRGRDHWLTMLATDPSANQAVWRGLPGFFWYAPVVKAKPGAEVLAVHESARNAAGRIPLLAQRWQWQSALHGHRLGVALAQRRRRHVSLPVLESGRAVDVASAPSRAVGRDAIFLHAGSAETR